MSPRDGAAGKPAERRSKPRYQRRLLVRFGTEARMFGGSIVNLSESGLRIECPESFPIHSIIQVFVQFRHHAVRLKARVAWTGGSEGGTAAMGLTFTQPEPALAKAYKEWLAEVKQMAREEPTGAAAPAPGTGSATPSGGDSPPAPAAGTRESPGRTEAPPPRTQEPPAGAPPAPEPRSPVRRRLESPQGLIYDVLLEKDAGGWNVTAVQVPRALGAGRSDLEGSYPSYTAAEQALRAFVRSH